MAGKEVWKMFGNSLSKLWKKFGKVRRKNITEYQPNEKIIRLKIQTRSSPIKNDLPRNWRLLVVKTLAGKGIEVTLQKVSDIKRGKTDDPALRKAISAEIRKLQKKQRKKKACHTVVVIHFSCPCLGINNQIVIKK